MPDRLLTGLIRALSLSALLLAAHGLRPMALSAEVPVKFNYQGNLRQSGFLVNGNRNMVFRVYDSSTNGTELCPGLVHNNVSISTGVFRVTLEPALTDWQTGSLWLELEVDGNRMSPREELTSSPYAINSLMLSGKRYTSAAAAPAGSTPGELWYDSVLKTVNFWNGAVWVPTAGGGAAETDPLSIHNQDTPQAGTTFYVSSGTVNYLNINNSLKVTGTALFKGVDTQNYSFAVSTGTAHQVVVSTSGAVGIGTENPRAKMEVTGGEVPGQYIMIFNSGAKLAAWLRNK